MFFFLDHRCASDAPAVQVQVLTAPNLTATPAPQVLYISPGVQRLETLALPGGRRLLLLGDPVFGDRARASGRVTDWQGELNLTALFSEVRGHYYWFLLQNDSFRCGSSFGAIFPIYHQTRDGHTRVSSASFFLATQADPGRLDRRNLLERLLFNYPLFGTTWWSGISLLGTHRWLTLSAEGAKEARAFGLENYFGHGFHSNREALDQLTEVFEDECRLFLPDEPFAISFTGGFDGRTLVAAARKTGRVDFSTYSFGMPGESDVTFPAAQAEQMGVRYWPIKLDTDYVHNHALKSALAFVQLSEYNGNFGRAHYHYAAQALAQKKNYILTGNFGSELFRAMHQPGVMMTEALIRVFESPDASWKDYLRQAVGRHAAAFFRMEMDALIADLERFLRARSDIDRNQQFYCFVLEEIFRKYFGPELVMQSHLLRNRTPYLSLRFFEALNKTIWSGLHARLFDKQKNRRMKGQVFYSAFLQRTDEQLYRMPTNKGYSPADVLESWRHPLLLARVARQKFLRRETGDSNAVETYFRKYQRDLSQRIRANEHQVLMQSGIAQHIETSAPLALSLEKTIHLFSVAAGWSAAAKSVKPIAPFQTV
jgi:asparagine synthetase B (glutamine-hydrolysing)